MTAATCPRCGGPLGPHPALSRADNTTPVCSACGTLQAFLAWRAVNPQLPSRGQGKSAAQAAKPNASGRGSPPSAGEQPTTNPLRERLARAQVDRLLGLRPLTRPTVGQRVIVGSAQPGTIVRLRREPDGTRRATVHLDSGVTLATEVDALSRDR